MSKKQIKQDLVEQDLADSLAVIIPTIVRSRIPDGHKLAYLFLIADGTFSMQAMEDIEKDMHEYSTKQEAYIASKKSEIADLEAQIEALDKQIDEVAVHYTKDLKNDTDQLLHLASKHAEEVKKGEHKASIKHLKKRLSE